MLRTPTKDSREGSEQPIVVPVRFDRRSQQRLDAAPYWNTRKIDQAGNSLPENTRVTRSKLKSVQVAPTITSTPTKTSQDQTTRIFDYSGSSTIDQEALESTCGTNVVSISSNNSNQGSNSSLDTVRDIGAATSAILEIVHQVQANEIRNSITNLLNISTVEGNELQLSQTSTTASTAETSSRPEPEKRKPTKPISELEKSLDSINVVPIVPVAANPIMAAKEPDVSLKFRGKDYNQDQCSEVIKLIADSVMKIMEYKHDTKDYG
jgi:hypothetical protein